MADQVIPAGENLSDLDARVNPDVPENMQMVTFLKCVPFAPSTRLCNKMLNC